MSPSKWVSISRTDHGTGKMCDGLSSAWATICPSPSTSTQEKSCASWMMEEYAVATRFARISRTTETRVSWRSSRVMASTSPALTVEGTSFLPAG